MRISTLVLFVVVSCALGVALTRNMHETALAASCLCLVIRVYVLEKQVDFSYKGAPR